MSRTEQIKTERRRRNSDALGGARRRLYVNEAELDREKYHYRWVNDAENRLFQMTVQDDYEIVADREGLVRPDGSGAGTEVAVPVGTSQEGRPMRAVLCRKPREYHHDDERAKLRAIDDTEAGIKQPTAAASQEGVYAKDGMSLGHGARP